MSTLNSATPGRRAILAATALVFAACWPAARAADPADSAEVVVRALALLGVPYRWGGNDPARGLDCSGLVRHVFKAAVALDLPRRSEQMSRLGRAVARGELRAGDLVFFNTLGRPNSHVALYVGDGRFIHAPGRNRQVRVDGMDDSYWRHRFNGARRIVVALHDGPPAAEPERQTRALSWRSDDFPNGP